MKKFSKNPIVIVSGSFDNDRYWLNRGYAEALSVCGAIPFLVFPTKDTEKIRKIADVGDAFLFAGGGDIHPSRYGESFCHENNRISLERDEFEFLLFDEAFKDSKAILGICRGMQLINVAFGGTLCQEMPGHMDCEHDAWLFGRLALLTDKKRVKVNSYHRQTADKISSELENLAVTCDGKNTPEAVGYFKNDKYVLGVQWHPEKSFFDDELSRKIFEDFISAVKK